VQPFLAACVAFVSFPYVLLDWAGRTAAGAYPNDPTDTAMGVAFGVAILVLVITLVGVLPTAVWVVKRRPLSLAVALAFGVGFGNLPIVLGTVLSGGAGAGGLLRTHLFASLIGVTGAAVFWIISIRGRDFSRDPRR